MLGHFVQRPILHLGMLLMAGLALPVAATHSLAVEGNIEVKPIDAVVKANPLPRDTNAAIVESFRAGGAELGVLVMRENRLHHHSHQDHVLYLVRGEGLAQLENAAGQVETRTVKPGDIFALPRGKKHGFRKSGEEDLVFLVVATPPPPGVEETTYHE
jgi:mannose-6-phosphate isomerase-like protein (cupin superfamily)